MTSTRNDPERDLDYIPRTYEGGPAYPKRRTKTLTSTQQNHRANRIEAEHAATKGRPILEPTPTELASMSPEQRADMVSHIRQLREVASQAGSIIVPAELGAAPIQPQLPLES